MHKIFASFLSLMVSILLYSPLSQAQLEVQPHLKWKTLNTSHFELIFNAEQQDLAHLYAEKLEKAFYELKPYFSSFPKKTVVVINDKTDVTNGYATRIPYPHIMAFPVLPGPEDSLADMGDWAYELLAHEYTHILTFEPANGVMVPLRGVFGNIIAPNILLPQWWKEGVAVEMETRLGRHGRLRSFFQEANLRALVEAKTFKSYDIAQANESIPSWPFGARPYIFGSLMWSQMLSDKGASIVSNLSENHGSRVPYFVEQPAWNYLGRSYESQYKKMQNDVEERTTQQLVALQQETPTRFIVPKNNYQSVSAPAISPNGKHLALVAEDDGNSRTVRIITKEIPHQSFLEAKSSDTVDKFDEGFAPAAQNDGPPEGSIRRISWFPDSTKIIYDKIDYTNRIERYSDLFTYDLVEKKTKRLTRGLRGREPSVSALANKVAFIKLEGGKTSLALLDITSETPLTEVLFTAPLNERLSYPMFWNDDSLIFSWRNSKGEENLFVYSISKKTSTKILNEFPTARFAKKVAEGLLFSSTKNGVPNLYIAAPDLKSARPASHTLTGLFTADFDSQRREIFATQMTEKGLRVSVVTADEWQKAPAVLPQVDRLFADRYSQSRTPTEDQSEKAAKDDVALATTEDYSAASYLLPRYWMPFIAASSSETGVVLQALTSGFDPLKKHSYSVLASYDTGLNQASVQGTYLNQTTSLPVLATAYRRNSYLGTVSNQLTDLGGQVAVLPNMFWLSIYTSAQTGWVYVERSTDISQVKRTGPFALLQYANLSQSGAEISPESGIASYLGAFHYINQNDYLSHSQFIAGGSFYFSKFLPAHHVTMLRINALYTPELISSIYGGSTESFVYNSDSSMPQYILRGYKRGQIYGRNLATANLEYRFPLKDIYRGSGTDPIFLRRLSGALVADGAATDGRVIDDKAQASYAVNMKEQFWSAGAEVKLETTLGYVLPISFILGYYVPFNGPSARQGAGAVSIQFQGF